jgi:hypothetical protein
MTTCIDCNLEMATADGCSVTELIIDGVPYVRRRCTRRRCGDCGAKAGRLHHLGCDLEGCPRCRRQLITCGCWNDDPGEAGSDDADPAIPWSSSVPWGH